MQQKINLTEEMFSTFTRNNTYFNNIENSQKDKYLKLYTLYIDLFFQFIIKSTNLDKFDELLKNDSHKFVPIETEEMDIYQLMTSSYLKYFYLRNNLYLERLTKEELVYLDNKLNTNDNNLDSTAYNFINSTYRKVIFEIINQESKLLADISYGPLSGLYFAPNNALVLGVRYDEFNLNGMDEEAWEENYIEQGKVIESLINKIEPLIQDKLQIVCKIKQYSESSINDVIGYQNEKNR